MNKLSFAVAASLLSGEEGLTTILIHGERLSVARTVALLARNGESLLLTLGMGLGVGALSGAGIALVAALARWRPAATTTP